MLDPDTALFPGHKKHREASCGTASKRHCRVWSGPVIVALLALPTSCGVRAEGATRGQALYETCAPCHGSEGAGSQAFQVPAIAGLAEWYVQSQLEKFRTGLRGAHHKDLEGLRMRPMSRALSSEDDVKAVASYVASLSPVRLEPTFEGDIEKGKVAYTPCVTCHGADGKGIQEQKAPSLQITDDWYLLEQLKKFKAGHRGAVAADVTGQQMRPTAIALPDEQAMMDVIAYIKSQSE